MAATCNIPAVVTGAPGHRGTGASRADRPTSFRLQDFPEPTGREEEWRFTPLAPLAPLMGRDLPGTLDIAINQEAPDGGASAGGNAADAGPQVSVETVPSTDPRLGRTSAPSDRTAGAAWEGAPEATVVTVPAGAAIDQPVTITMTGRGPAPAAHHLLLRAEPGSRAAIVLEYRGTATLTQT
ncbi:MAG: hypothetical protein LBM66_06470, partial [Bifidobacteriaceae bacterium]|nr:hypothetical protein [Bifidobacteriaceae bacterium]